MSFWRLVLTSLLHYRRLNAAVAMGAAAATAVLTGALLVGDSVRGSLTAITFDRLGRIDEALVTDRFFRTELADELAATPEFQEYYAKAQAVILFPNATIETQRDGRVQRSANVLLIGAADSFWEFGTAGVKPIRMPQGEQIVLNEQLASQWEGRVGETTIIRLPRPTAVPADSAYGRKTDNVLSIPDVEIVDIVPNKGLGRFSLQPSQAQPLVAFVPIELLQKSLDRKERANTILVAGKDENTWSIKDVNATLNQALKPQLSDYGFTIQHVQRSFQDKNVYDYYSFESDRMLISPEAEVIGSDAFRALGGNAMFTYFVNSIGAGNGKAQIPYSMVTAVESSTLDLMALAGKPGEPLKAGEIVLTSWAAADQQVKLGDSVELSYFLPETSHGVAKEASAQFRLRGVVPLTEPAEPYEGETPAVFETAPTRVNDPELTPLVEGITDKDSIANLDVPFPFDIDRLRDQDDEFWRNHRTTPKAYVSLADGQRMWGSRFGRATSFRIPHREGLSETEIAEAFLSELRKQQATLGMDFQPVKLRGARASSGTTPFDGLFLALSMFIICAALMLVSLLFRLGVEQRLSELGVLLAVGFRRRLAARAFVAEGLLVATIGGAFGVILGIAYAWLMLVGLRTVWVDAVATPFLELHWTPRSLAIGFVSGIATSLLTIIWGIRESSRSSIHRLLAGQISEATARGRSAARWRAAAIVLLVSAIGLALLGVGLSGEAQAGCFVGTGAAVLSALLILTWTYLRFGRHSNANLSLLALATRNAGRNSSRSTTTIGLMAVASFLIISMSAFRLAPSLDGAAGFELSAFSSQPIFEDLNEPAARADLLADSADVLDGGQVLAFRVKPGDDASCRNLYQATAPQVLGVSDETVTYFDSAKSTFAFAASGGETDEEKQNPWRLLQSSAESGGPIPVIVDKNTAMYSLHLLGGVGEKFKATYDGYGTLEFRVVGLLSNSVLQGRLLIGEADFKQSFPEVAGYRFFLIHSPKPMAETAAALEDRLGDQGFDTQSTVATLDGLLAVQNTYLSTFQSLGSLGLLLGTFGLAAVQLRGVFERRGELALMRAAGFPRSRVAWMVMYENASLLAAGLLLGVIGAVVAIAPHIIATGASVPWPYLASVLLIVFAVGLTSSISSVRATLKAPVIAALRGD